MRPRHDQRGIALLLVLWIFMILGVLALDFARYIRDDAMAAVNLADETHGYYVALAGMNKAIFDAERARERAPGTTPANPNDPRKRQSVGQMKPQPTDEDDDEPEGIPPDGQWHEDVFAGGRYAVRMTDEGGRVSLNKADELLLTRVVTNLLRGGNATTGVDKRTADSIGALVDAIIDWRDPDDLVRLNGAESDYYLGLRNPYRAKNAFFDSPEELLLVRGVTPAMLYGSEGTPGLRDVFSVYSKSRRINVKAAPPAVLQVLLDVDAATAADLAAQRDSDPGGFLPVIQAQVAQVDPHLAELLVDEEPRIVTIEARADLTEERNQSRVAVVADITSDVTEGARILRWLDRAPFEGVIPAGDNNQGPPS